MKPEKLRNQGIRPLISLLWLLVGPIPLFLVLAIQAHRTPVKQPGTGTSPPPLLMVATPTKSSDPVEFKTEVPGKKPEKSGKIGNKAGVQMSGAKTR